MLKLKRKLSRINPLLYSDKADFYFYLIYKKHGAVSLKAA